MMNAIIKPQVHYRTGYVAPLIPVYGELDVDADDVVVPVLEKKTEPTPPTPPKTTHALPPSSSEGKSNYFYISPLDDSSCPGF